MSVWRYGSNSERNDRADKFWRLLKTDALFMVLDREFNSFYLPCWRSYALECTDIVEKIISFCFELQKKHFEVLETSKFLNQAIFESI